MLGAVLGWGWKWAGVRRSRGSPGRQGWVCTPTVPPPTPPRAAWGAFVVGGKQCPRPEDAAACPEALLRRGVGAARAFAPGPGAPLETGLGEAKCGLRGGGYS